MKKRILSVLTCLTLCLSLLPSAAFAEEAGTILTGDLSLTVQASASVTQENTVRNWVDADHFVDQESNPDTITATFVGSSGDLTLGTDYKLVWMIDGEEVYQDEYEDWLTDSYTNGLGTFEENVYEPEIEGCNNGAKVTVKAVGIGSYTGVVSCDTEILVACMPDCPEDINVEAGDQHLIVTWTAPEYPSQGGAALDRYVVSIHNLVYDEEYDCYWTGDSIATQTVVATDEYTCTFENLENDKQYAVKAAAVNKAGISYAIETIGMPVSDDATIPTEYYKLIWSNGDGDEYEQVVAVGTIISIPSSDLFNETMRKGCCTITGWTSDDENYCVGDAMPAQDLTFTADYLVSHNFTDYYIGEMNYENDSIFAKCSNNCAEYGNGAAIATLYAPTDAVYEQGLYHNAGLGGYTSQIEIDSDSIVYTKDGEVTNPIDAGTYMASVSYGGVTASVEYDIEKAPLTITAKSYLIEVGSVIPDLTSSDAYIIDGFTGEDDANVLIGDIILFYDSDPDSTEEGYYSIWFETEPTADNYDVYCESGELRIVTCVHNFTEYYLDTVNEENDSIFAKCSNGCTEYGSGGAIVTLYAPEDAVYEQGLYHNASFGYDSQIDLDWDSIVYTKDGEVADPVNAGTYVASITYGDVTASVTYDVAKRSLTITADDKTVYVGDNVLTYSYTVTGWEDSHDNEDEFAHKLSGVTVVCEDANLNQAGTYTLTISGTPVVFDSDGNDVSENYALTTQNGTLTVQMHSIPVAPSIPAYPPVVYECDNGDAFVSPKYPEKGETVTITANPNAGYEVDKVIVKDKNGDPVMVTDNGNGTYSFVQPNGKVNIEVTFKEIIEICPGDSTCPMHPYTDLDSSQWYHDGIHYCIKSGLMQGDNSQFDPNGTTTRAMIVTVLWRLAGEPVVNYAMSFEDVESDKWYTEAVRWAASEKIVEGYGNGRFGTGDDITREQLATILYRYEQYTGGGFTGAWMIRMDYVDLANVSDWAYEAMCWMSMNEVITGKPGKVLDPKGHATRAEAAVMLYRYCDAIR